MRDCGKGNLYRFFLFLLLLISAPAYGESEKIIVVYTDWFPYTYEKNGEAAGFEIEVFRAVMENMNMDAEFRALPWKRCLFSMKEGQADALISLLKTPEREEFIFFPDNHISISKTVLFTRADTGIQFSGSYEELKGYTIGIISGFSYGEAFDRAEYLKKDESRDAEMLIRKLMKKRNDLAAENLAVVIASASKMQLADKIRFLEPPIHNQKLYVGFSKAKDRKKLCDDFSVFLGKFKKTESYKSILGKYGVTYSDVAE